MTRYRIIIKPIDETDTIEVLEFSSEEGRCYPTEQYLNIHREPTSTGSYHQQRCIPWGQIIDYSSIEVAA